MDDIHHYAFLDALQGIDRIFYLAEFNPESANFHLAIISAEIFQIAVAQPTHPIAGFV